MGKGSGRIRIACLVAVFGSMVQGCATYSNDGIAMESVDHMTGGKMMIALFERARSGASGNDGVLDTIRRIASPDLSRLVVYRSVSQESPAIDAVVELYGADDMLRSALESVESDLGDTYEIHAYSVFEHLPLCYERDWPDGTPTPDVTRMSLAIRRRDLSRDEFSAY